MTVLLLIALGGLVYLLVDLVLAYVEHRRRVAAAAESARLSVTDPDWDAIEADLNEKLGLDP